MFLNNYLRGINSVKKRINKKIICLMLSVAVLICTFPSISVGAVQANEADFSYFTEDDAAVISDYTGSDTEVIIPSTIDGYQVCAVGSYAFSNNSTVTSVTIPEGVLSIYENAFDYCSALEKVVLPESLINIYSYAFNACDKLTSLSIHGSVEYVASGLFYYEGDGEYPQVTVYFEGTQEQWNALDASMDENLTVHYNTLTAHNNTEPLFTKPGSCMMPEYSYYLCPCGIETEVKSEVSGHNFTDGVCSNCGVSQNELMSVKGDAYVDEMYVECTVSRPGAKYIDFYFSADSFTEENFDIISFKDEEGNVLKTASGNLNNKVVSIHAETVIINFSTDMSVTENGFEIIDIVPRYEECAHEFTKIENAYDADCYNEGYTGDTVCRICSQIITEGVITEKRAHEYVNGFCKNCHILDVNYIFPIIDENSTTNITLKGGERVYYKFIPSARGNLTYSYSSGDFGVTVELLDSNFSSMNGDSIENEGIIEYRYYVEANKTYYYRIDSDFDTSAQLVNNITSCEKITTAEGIVCDITPFGAAVVGYTGSAKDITIPEMIDEYSVVYICDDILNGNTTVKTVTVNCNGVQIYADAFRGSVVEKLYLENASYNAWIDYILIGEWRQSDLEVFMKVVYDDGTFDENYLVVYKDDQGVFYEINPYSTMVVDYIGSAKHINICEKINGEYIRSIDSQAFSGNTTLESVYFPYTIENVTQDIFDNTNIKTLYTEYENEYIEDMFGDKINVVANSAARVYLDKDKTIANTKDLVDFTQKGDAVSYKWYMCNLPDKSDASVLRGATGAVIAPLSYLKNRETSVKYFYCEATVTANGSKNTITSALCHNLYGAMDFGVYSYIDLDRHIPYIYTDSINNYGTYSNIVSFENTPNTSITVTPSLNGSIAGYGTGSEITAYTGDGRAMEFTVIQRGDLNGDSTTDVLDAFLLSQCIYDSSFSDYLWYAGELNYDGNVDVSDYQVLVNMMLADNS